MVSMEQKQGGEVAQQSVGVLPCLPAPKPALPLASRTSPGAALGLLRMVDTWVPSPWQEPDACARDRPGVHLAI